MIYTNRNYQVRNYTCDIYYKLGSCYFYFFSYNYLPFFIEMYILIYRYIFLDFVLNNIVSIPDTVKQLFLVSLV